MTKLVLLYEPKLLEVRRLAEAIQAAGDYTVNRARSMREVCTYLANQPHHLALIPITRNDTVVYSLRMLQPKLPIFLVTANPQEPIPSRQLQAVQGVIDQHEVIPALPDLLQGKLPPLDWKKQPASVETSHLDWERLTLIIQHALIDPYLLFAVIHYEDHMMGFHEAEHQIELDLVVKQVQRAWGKGWGNGVQMQFFPVNGRKDNILLYTRPLYQGYLLTLGLLWPVSLTHMKELAQQIVQQAAQNQLVNRKV